jgi:hypothetical protein
MLLNPPCIRAIGKSYIPSQLIMEQIACAFLYEDVFRIVEAHVVDQNKKLSESIVLVKN